MTTHTELRVKHPNLFRQLLAITLVDLLMMVLLVTDDPQRLIAFRRLPQQGIIPPLEFWGVIYGLAGIFILYGVLRNKFAWSRRGLILSASVGGFWAFGFITSYFTGAIQGISAPLLWSFFTLTCIIVSSEPAVNPLAALLQQNIHTTLQDARHRDGVLARDHPHAPTMESRTSGENRNGY